MMECFDLASKGLGRVSPNPMVGAVLVKNGRIISRGYHKVFGGPHAEVDCLDNCKYDPAGGTMYVNLEPCCYHGKTPPCTELLIKTGIRKVVVAMKDPNPRVAGKGLRALSRAGIQVEAGVLEERARDQNRWFITNMRSRRPFIHVKVAQSLDGRIASLRKRNERISSKASQVLVHHWRATHDAVLVGAGTIIADNPRLDVRCADGRNPAVLILDGKLRVPESSRVFHVNARRRVLVCTSVWAAKNSSNKVQRMQSRGIEVLSFKGNRDGSLNLQAVLKRLYSAGTGSILVEGGAATFANLMHGGLVDQLSIFIAPKVFTSGLFAFPENGASAKPFLAKHTTSTMVGQDILIQSLFS